MSDAKILTSEQVTAYKKYYRDQHDIAARVIDDLSDSHEALRAEVEKLEQKLRLADNHLSLIEKQFSEYVERANDDINYWKALYEAAVRISDHGGKDGYPLEAFTQDMAYANSRLAELNLESARLKLHVDDIEKANDNCQTKIADLERENEKLRTALELALSFCPKGVVPPGLNPMFYHTHTYEGDAELQERIDKARQALIDALEK
jgi:cysteinyl-tRNA synthetase